MMTCIVLIYDTSGKVATSFSTEPGSERLGQAPSRCRRFEPCARRVQGLAAQKHPSNPDDDTTCESFLKTHKRESIHSSTYRDFEDLRERMEEFIVALFEG